MISGNAFVRKGFYNISTLFSSKYKTNLNKNKCSVLGTGYIDSAPFYQTNKIIMFI